MTTGSYLAREGRGAREGEGEGGGAVAHGRN